MDNVAGVAKLRVKGEKARMSNRRIIYNNWIADYLHDPTRPYRLPIRPQPVEPLTDREKRDRDSVCHAVQDALAVLDENERHFITLHYYLGWTIRRISERSGRSVNRLAGLHRRALRRLRRELAEFAETRFRFNLDPEQSCPICTSPYRGKIDRLIADRDPDATWAPLMKCIRDRFGITVGSPQLLIGHERYHCRSPRITIREEPRPPEQLSGPTGQDDSNP